MRTIDAQQVRETRYEHSLICSWALMPLFELFYGFLDTMYWDEQPVLFKSEDAWSGNSIGVVHTVTNPVAQTMMSKGCFSPVDGVKP